ncbi:MAG TPA: hypothetical protein DG761_01370, partial [Gammaproteobacteria bacterium]|nr:hypothetical protein [Gammaproteobacteria bacterium]
HDHWLSGDPLGWRRPAHLGWRTGVVPPTKRHEQTVGAHLLPVGRSGWQAGPDSVSAVGSVVGALFAAVVLAVSAFSLPMLLDRRTDSITAVISSGNAVLPNKNRCSSGPASLS